MTRSTSSDRLGRVIAQAQRRYERRQAAAVLLWDRYQRKWKKHPTLWFTPYERAYALEDEAYLLLMRLRRCKS